MNEEEKKLAAIRAVREIQTDMLVGLGTGTTAAFVVTALAERMKNEGLRVRAVSTSHRTEALARENGIAILDFESVSAVDLAIDGADEIDAKRRAIKGGGGALFREKVVAASAARMIAVVDSSKPVAVLGKFPLPLEVVPFAAAFVLAQVRALGVEPIWRRNGDAPYKTDQGNYVLDCSFGRIDDPEGLAAKLTAIPGILEHGLFLTEIDAVCVAGELR